MPDIIYTLATQHHIPILIEFRIKFLIEFGGPQSQEAQDLLAKELETFFENNLNRNYFCWFAQVNNEVAGIGAMSLRLHPGSFKNPSGKMAYIMNMYTSPAFRKMGICKNILNKVQQTAQEMDIHLFELHATPAGEPVYVKDGFLLHNEPTYRKWNGG